MALYTPKNNKDVEAIKLPRNYTRLDLEAVSRWLIRHAPNTTFMGERRSDSSFQIVLRNISHSFVVEPSSYISIDPKTSQLTLTDADEFEKEFDPKFVASNLASGTINGTSISTNSLKMPPTSLHWFL